MRRFCCTPPRARNEIEYSLNSASSSKTDNRVEAGSRLMSAFVSRVLAFRP